MKFRRYFLIVSFIILLLFVGVQYTIYNLFKEQVINDLNSSQLIHARQAANGIQDYIYNEIRTLNFLSQLPEIKDLNSTGKKTLIDYQKHISDEITSITRMDENGKIIFTYPNSESIGKDISNQGHIKYILNYHKTVVSEVFEAVQGFRTVGIHVPIFKNGRFTGTLAFLLSFNNISQKYLENIRIGKTGYPWVVSKNGIEIYSLNQDRIGKNVYELYKDFPDLMSMINDMMKGNQGVTTYHFNRVLGQPAETVLKHAVYMPIPLVNTSWFIVVATPEDEVLDSLIGLRTKLTVIVLALFVIYLICIYYIVKSQVIVKEQKKRGVVLSALRESEERYRTLFEQNPAPTLIYERGTYKMLAVNNVFLQHYGYSREEILNMLLTDIYPFEDRTLLIKTADDLVGYKNVGEWRHIKKDGSIINITACSNDLIYNGHVARIAVITDVTERRIFEDRIQSLNTELENRVTERTAELEISKERAESADKLKSAFLATMSHELRTPLNSIIGFTGILLKGMAGPLNDEQMKQLGMAKGSAQHLLELINDVLDISKIEAGELVVAKKVFNLKKTISKIVSSIQPLAEKKHIILQAQVADNVNEVESDERRVEQILINLLNNAVKFTEAGFVKIKSEISDHHVKIVIIDTGIGLKKEDMNKLFKPFSQIDTGLTRSHEGTGLGLSITQRLVEKLGGTISVESTYGEGSIFSFTLPL
jgi:PAS domain S-box-containing protein